MDDRKLNFGPRYDADLNWVCVDDTPADDADVGLEVTIDEDGCMQISIGSKLERQEWELTPEETGELTAFFYKARGMDLESRTERIRQFVEEKRDSIARGARRSGHRFKL